MSDHLVFQKCPRTITLAMRKYWTRKTERLQRLLERFPPHQRELTLSVHPHPLDATQYEMHAIVKLPLRTISAKAHSPLASFQRALDEVAEGLSAEIRRHLPPRPSSTTADIQE
jgi:ribosome-associated translation inhibitor RaiA